MKLGALFSESAGAFEAPRSLYLHIPFCSSRCSYCDFHSFACVQVPAAKRALYADRLLQRALSLCEALETSPETIYIGGGTPTVLDEGSLGRLLGGLRASFGSSIREWTVEANPESLKPATIEALLANGVTRLSLGIQSMDDQALRLLGREARSADNRRAVALAAGSGLALSADLIAALPKKRDSEGEESGIPSLSDSVAYLASQGFGHLSLYDLVVEEGTVLKRRLDDGELSLADEDLAFEERREVEALLDRLGFHRYEVSNYCLPGQESLHNGAYWSMNSYLGIGSGAVSTLIVSEPEKARKIGSIGGASLRIEEGRDLSAYLENPDAASVLTWIDTLDSAFEMVMMALRTSRGLDEARFLSRFGLDARAVLGRTINTWKARFSESGNRLFLDGAGMNILNRILVDALEEMTPHFPGKNGNPR